MKDFAKILKKDPGSGVFVDYARALLAEGKKEEALHVLLSGLSHNSGNREGRLMLARLHYDLNQLPFAVRQLEILRGDMPESAAIGRLIDKLQPGGSRPSRTGKPEEGRPPSGPAVLSEAEFDLEDLEILDKD